MFADYQLLKTHFSPYFTNSKFLFTLNHYSTRKYFIIIYQNGVVCNPCLKLISNFYHTYIKQSDSVSSNKLIIIGNNNYRTTFLELRKYNLESLLYIDVYEEISQNVIQNALPVNFVLLINDKRQIVSMDYFTNEDSERLSSFAEIVKKKAML